MNAFLRKVATVCVAFLLCASMGTIAFANDLPIYSEWAKAEVSAAENEGLLPFEMYDDCRRALHRDWATAFLVKFVEIATNASIEGSDVQVKETDRVYTLSLFCVYQVAALFQKFSKLS